MNNLLNHRKNIAVFINDFYEEYEDSLKKLSNKLERPIRGVLLLDSDLKKQQNPSQQTPSWLEEIVCDFNDPAALHKVFKEFGDNLLFVSCGSERSQPYFQLVLPHAPYACGPTESSLGWSTHKAKMRELLGSFNPTLVPKVQEVSNDSAATVQKVIKKLKFPMIVKPTGLAASILVSKVHTEAELQEVLSKSFAVIHEIYNRDRGRGDAHMIVEEFIEGDMYSTDAYINEKGKVWLLPFLRVRTGYDMGLEGFYTYQTDSFIELNDAQIKAGQAAAQNACHALGLRSCVAHIELYHTKTGWKIIELGPRPGGRRQDIYAVSYGIDHAYNEFLIKAGLAPEIKTKAIAYSTTIKFYPDQEGIINTIDGVDEARNNPSVYNLKTYATPGDTALLSNNGGKYVVDGVLANTDLHKLEQDVAHVRSTINIGISTN